MDKKKIALVHIIKKELNLSDEEYRNILWNASGVRSSKDLDEEKFRKLMNFFVRSSYYQVNKFGLTIKQKLYVKYLTRNLGWETGHLNNFLHKYYHKQNIDDLTKKEAIKAIESLKNIRQHQAV
jgi:phage gp16-like protein